MEDFLKQIKLSEQAINIYLNIVGRKPLTSNEIYAFMPKLSQENYLRVIEELISFGLVTRVTPLKNSSLTHYLALPPFNPIIDYFTNIKANLNSIKNQLRQLLNNSLKNLFKENKLIEVDSLLKATQNLRNDIQEENIIQKQDVEDIVQGMENLRVIEKVLNDLHQIIKGITQTQFGNLIKTISSIKDDINQGITLLELKKHEKEVKKIVENSFKKHLNELVAKFTVDLNKLVEDEFNKKIESLNNIIDSSFQFRDDFKMLLLNNLNSFELKISSLHDSLKSKKQTLSDDLEKFQETIVNNLDNVIKNSVDSIAALSDPISNVMEHYRKLRTFEKFSIERIWVINSELKINEEIINVINNSMKDLLIVIPTVEHHLKKEYFDKIHSNIKIKIFASEAHTNSSVKNLKDVKNMEYKTLKNENLFVLMSDNDYLIVGIRLSETDNQFNNIIGLGTNYTPFIQLLNPIVKSILEVTSSDQKEVPKSITIDESTRIVDKTKEPTLSKTQISNQNVKLTPKPIKPPGLKHLEKETSLKSKLQPPSQEIAISPTNLDFSQQTKQHTEFIQKIHPKADDEAGILIINAFNSLIQKLGTLNGEEFSNELQKVSDIILEKKGFSVTLHKLRSTINQYKEQYDLLKPDDIKQIIENIEDWKKHIL